MMHSSVLKKARGPDWPSPEESGTPPGVKMGSAYLVQGTTLGRPVFRVPKPRKMSSSLWDPLRSDLSQREPPVEGLPEEGHYLWLL